MNFENEQYIVNEKKQRERKEKIRKLMDNEDELDANKIDWKLKFFMITLLSAPFTPFVPVLTYGGLALIEAVDKKRAEETKRLEGEENEGNADSFPKQESEEEVSF